MTTGRNKEIPTERNDVRRGEREREHSHKKEIQNDIKT